MHFVLWRDAVRSRCLRQDESGTQGTGSCRFQVVLSMGSEDGTPDLPHGVDIAVMGDPGMSACRSANLPTC